MMELAMGPQNTVGAMGIMPRMAATAVSMMGLNRMVAAAMRASQSETPGFFSTPI